MKSLSTAVKVGFFTTIALVVLMVIVTWKSNFFALREGYNITGIFQNIEGLTLGSEVRYRGLNVGQVLKVDPGPTDIRVSLIIKKGLVIPADSELRVAYDGIVGQKFLEIIPGTESRYLTDGSVLIGISTKGIVDFVDIAAQNLLETKAILETIRAIVQDPSILRAFKDAVLTSAVIANNINKLTEELRETNAGIRAITTDPQFQQSVKSIANESSKTLVSANNFFDGVNRLKTRVSGDVQYGSASNIVKGNIDFYQSGPDYLRFGLGEGSNHTNPGIMDVLLSKQMDAKAAIHLGMINTSLGGGVDYWPSNFWMLTGDIYDINNPRPNVPKVRITSTHTIFDKYLDLTLQADDLFNSQRNYLIGIKVKGGF